MFWNYFRDNMYQLAFKEFYLHSLILMATSYLVFISIDYYPQRTSSKCRCSNYSVCHSFIHSFIHSFSHSFVPDISIATLQVHYYSEALPNNSIDTVSELTCRSPTGNCE